MSFKFELNQRVSITATGQPSVISGRAEYTCRAPYYWVNHQVADGHTTTSWFAESELSAICPACSGLKRWRRPYTSEFEVCTVCTVVQTTALKWDGVPRLHNWLATVLGKDNTPPLAKYGEMLLLNIAERMLGKPSTQEKIIVFHGRQGLKKSLLLRVLAGDHFSDDLSAKSTPNVWLKEISEIDLLPKHEATPIKHYLTNPKALRGNDPVFVGTSNTINLRYLQRRFVTFHMTTAPDIKWLSKNREQLLAEAAEVVGM